MDQQFSNHKQAPPVLKVLFLGAAKPQGICRFKGSLMIYSTEVFLIALCSRSTAAVLRQPVVGGRGGPVHQDGDGLHLTDSVERCHTDVGVGEGLDGVGDLSQHLGGVSAAEHGQLVHRPVPADTIEKR